MNEVNIKLLEENGWVVECESPFEIRYEDGGAFASGCAADIVLYDLKHERNNAFSLKEMKNSFNAGMNRGVYIASLIMNRPIDNKYQTFNEFIRYYEKK
ncbi:MAG: hypothetical protein PF487_08330 [Bacteroidales bacterium]|jgi:hypothetical protein|nr:hypothetical protein [Bacteroidales bacterium]